MGIIMLTGRLLSEDKVSGLSLGADHYLTKPVNLAELGATLVSLSRRLRVVPSPDPRAPKAWRFDPARRQLLSPTRVNVDITDTESRLLGALIQAAPLPLTRGRLVEALGASAEAYDTHRLDAHMHRLRRSCARWPAATWAYARSTASATSAPRPCRSWAASRPRPESATPATPRCIPPRPPPLRALHARRQRPRARQGPRPGCRRADPGPGGRGRARRQPQARAGGGRLAGRRLRPTRMRGAHQRAGHAVGTGRRARPRRRRRRRRAAAQVESPAQLDAGAGIGRGRRARRPSLVGHVRNAVGLSASGRHRRPSRLAALVVGTSDLVRICMRATRRAARKRCWRVRWPSWPPAPTDWRRWMACTWTWTMTRAWRWPASKAATRASTARR